MKILLSDLQKRFPGVIPGKGLQKGLAYIPERMENVASAFPFANMEDYCRIGTYVEVQSTEELLEACIH